MNNLTEPNFLLKDKVVIEAKYIEEIFDKSILWLKKENAKILEKKPPYFAVAMHQYGIDANLYPKKIQIDLSELKNKIEIEFKIMKSVSGRVNTRSIFFRKLIEDYYRFIGVNVDNDILKRIYPEKVLNTLIKRTLYGIFVLNLISIIVIISKIFGFWLDFILFLFMVMGFSGLSIPSIIDYFKYSKLKNRLY